MGAKRIAQLRPRGVVTDIPAELVSPERWTQTENVVFRDQETARVVGYGAVLVTPATPPEYLLFAPTDATNYWVYAGQQSLYATDGQTNTDISPAWVTPETTRNRFTGGTLNGVPFVNSPSNFPVSWDQNIANPAAVLPDWPANTSAESMRAYKFYLIALGIRGPTGFDGDLVQWSDAAAPGNIPQSWTTGPASDAGNNVIGDIPGDIVDGLTLRDDFIIYKENSTHLMQFVGGDAVFSFRTLFTKSGALNRNCIVEHEGYHYVITDSDVVRHDGQRLQSIIDEENRRTLFAAIDDEEFAAAFLFYNEAARELWACVPEQGEKSNTLALVYELDRREWGRRDLPGITSMARGQRSIAAPADDWDSDNDSWDSDATTWNQASLGAAITVSVMASVKESAFYEVDNATTAAGATINAVVSRESLDLGSPNTVKIVRRLWPKIDANPGTVLNFRVGG